MTLRSHLFIASKAHSTSATAAASALALLFIATMVLMPWHIANAQPSVTPEGDQDHLILPGNVTEPIEITRFVASFADTTRKLGLKEIQALPDTAFQRSSAIPSFGYTRDVIWHQLDFNITNDMTKRALLEIGPNYLNFIDVFLTPDGLGDPVWHTRLGDHVPASARQYGGRTHIAALPLMKPGNYRLYVRSQSNSANLIWVTLWPATDLVSSLSFRDLASNVFFGFVLALGLAYLALGLIARDQMVVLYSIWVVAIGITAAVVNGVVLSELRPEIPWLNDFLLGTSNIITYGVAVFLWLYIIDAKKKYPLAYKICCAYGFFVLAFAAGATTDLYTIFGTYIIPSHSVFMAIMCAILIKRAFEDAHNPRYLALLVVLALPTGAAIMIQLALSGVIEATRLRLELHSYTLMFHLVGMGIIMTVRLSRMDKERVTVVRKAEETTSLVEEQRKLISMLSHEFRTPLAVIQRSSEMLMLRLTSHKDDVLERLRRIQLQAQKLARLVDIFLTKDGIDTQELSLARKTVPINRFLQEFVAQTTREGAEVQAVLNRTAGLEIFIDETLMGLAITNLVETSRRFAHGAPIHINAHRHSEMRVEINIPCRGEELDEEEIVMISDALFRRDMESQSLQRALGLHISQRIVVAHGGSLTLRRNSTRSIELCLLLPCE
ncbi:7TM-DISM domain-containing protein [Thalassospira profundimaris]|uniref:sensor histidine kinase n=1 Tax=Thalassospira profundimaris TaxID=502049 RepID=UPI0002872D85|nr:7TM-DISM domain-containing protein [Thalassospira profundimaris]EKF07297.1 two-component sensor histidine kinase [Thalassospira profundimaris WP0211]